MVQHMAQYFATRIETQLQRVDPVARAASSQAMWYSGGCLVWGGPVGLSYKSTCTTACTTTGCDCWKSYMLLQVIKQQVMKWRTTPHRPRLTQQMTQQK